MPNQQLFTRLAAEHNAQFQAMSNTANASKTQREALAKRQELINKVNQSLDIAFQRNDVYLIQEALNESKKIPQFDIFKQQELLGIKLFKAGGSLSSYIYLLGQGERLHNKNSKQETIFSYLSKEGKDAELRICLDILHGTLVASKATSIVALASILVPDISEAVTKKLGINRENLTKAYKASAISQAEVKSIINDAFKAAIDNNQVKSLQTILRDGRSGWLKAQDLTQIVAEDSLMHRAIRTANIETQNCLLNFLMPNIISANNPHFGGQNLFHYAISNNRMDAALNLAENRYLDPAQLAAQLTDKDESLLHLGAQTKNAHTLKICLKINTGLRSPYDLSLKDKSGKDPLSYCADNYQCAKLLLKYGAKIDVNNPDHGQLINAMSKSGSLTELQDAVQLGLSINTKASDGTTPVMNVIERGDYEMLEYLISQGADLTQKNGQQHDALMLAAAQGDLSLLKIIDQAEPSLINNQVLLKGFFYNSTESALSIAHKSNNKELEQYLVARGAKGSDKIRKQILKEKAFGFVNEIYDIAADNDVDHSVNDRLAQSIFDYLGVDPESQAANNIKIKIKPVASELIKDIKKLSQKQLNQQDLKEQHQTEIDNSNFIWGSVLNCVYSIQECFKDWSIDREKSHALESSSNSLAQELDKAISKKHESKVDSHIKNTKGKHASLKAPGGAEFSR